MLYVADEDLANMIFARAKFMNRVIPEHARVAVVMI